VAPFTGEEDLSRHLVESLVADEFDIVTCQEMVVDPEWLPPPHVPHPWPEERVAVRYWRHEPYARIGRVRICAGVPGNRHPYRDQQQG
jgi:hypothetical protein